MESVLVLLLSTNRVQLVLKWKVTTTKISQDIYYKTKSKCTSSTLPESYLHPGAHLRRREGGARCRRKREWEAYSIVHGISNTPCSIRFAFRLFFIFFFSASIAFRDQSLTQRQSAAASISPVAMRKLEESASPSSSSAPFFLSHGSALVAAVLAFAIAQSAKIFTTR